METIELLENIRGSKKHVNNMQDKINNSESISESELRSLLVLVSADLLLTEVYLESNL